MKTFEDDPRHGAASLLIGRICSCPDEEEAASILFELIQGAREWSDPCFGALRMALDIFSSEGILGHAKSRTEAFLCLAVDQPEVLEFLAESGFKPGPHVACRALCLLGDRLEACRKGSAELREWLHSAAAVSRHGALADERSKRMALDKLESKKLLIKPDLFAELRAAVELF